MSEPIRVRRMMHATFSDKLNDLLQERSRQARRELDQEIQRQLDVLGIELSEAVLVEEHRHGPMAPPIYTVMHRDEFRRQYPECNRCPADVPDLCDIADDVCVPLDSL